jgi:undecaprenyl-diphosphatase
VFDKTIEEFFAAPSQAALFLVANGLLLFGAEILRRKREVPDDTESLDEGIVRLTFRQAFLIGSMQALALFPGISRTGSALAGGLMARLNHEQAALFAFLLATPLIFAAGVLKLPKLLHATGYPIGPILLGAVVSAGAAYVAISFLSSYFRTKNLLPFAFYCVLAGAISYVIIG